MKFAGIFGVLALVVLGAYFLTGKEPRAEATEIVVYKSPTCGCCGKWEEHLRAAGFQVVSRSVEDLSAVKAEQGVPENLQSCHTALVNGYVVEGHVPAASIQKLLVQKPEVAGIAVPGMPIGSPGMEGPNPESYEVLAFKKTGETTVLDRY